MRPDFVKHDFEFALPLTRIRGHKGRAAGSEGGKVTVPDVPTQAHSAPLQIVFYEGNDFPASYKGRRPSSLCTVPGIVLNGPATRSCACCSTTQASRPANTRTS